MHFLFPCLSRSKVFTYCYTRVRSYVINNDYALLRFVKILRKDDESSNCRITCKIHHVIKFFNELLTFVDDGDISGLKTGMTTISLCKNTSAAEVIFAGDSKA